MQRTGTKRLSLTVSLRSYENFVTYSQRRGDPIHKSADRLFGILKPERYPLPDISISKRPSTTTPRILPDNVVFSVRDRHKTGESYRKIAKDLKVSLGTIQRAINGQNGYKQVKRKGRPPASIELCHQVRQRKASGATYTVLERETNLSRKTLWSIVNRKGAYAFR